MSRCNRGNIFLGVAFVCCLNLASTWNAAAQERQWGGGHGGFAGFGGASSGFGLVPSVVADVLLVPSLTKAQQAKIRTLYIDYRTKSAGRMDVMRKLGGGSPHHRRDESGDSGRSGSRAQSSESSSGASSKSKNSDSLDGKRWGRSRDQESGMDNASSNLRRTMFMSMLKEHQKFQEAVVKVLTEKQHAELKEIAKKAGSPDYFAVRHYDIMNAD